MLLIILNLNYIYMKKLLIITCLFISFFTFSQELNYKTGGRIFNSEGEKMSPKEVRELLAKQPGMLQFYNNGRGQKTMGNILFYGGLIAIPTEFLIKAGENSNNYPTILTYLSIGSILLSIPIKAGYTKKIKTVVKDYNKELSKKDTSLQIDQINFVTNQNGVGLKITF
jgi:hypothetical protein